jgi:hypothetical protein
VKVVGAIMIGNDICVVVATTLCLGVRIWS